MGLLAAIVGGSIVAGCGNDDELANPPEHVVFVRSGNFSTTARSDRPTELPFNEVIEVDIQFEEPVHRPDGRTTITVEAEPTTYRVESRLPPDLQTYSFTLHNRNPGTVDVRVVVGLETKAIEFTLAVQEPKKE
jgi:hypothetical protein